MAVPSTGSLSLAKIRDEIENNNYNANLYGYTSGQTSLGDISNGTYGTINSSSSSKPDGSAPHGMAEFYGYDHDASSITQIGSTYTGQYSTSAWQTVSIDVTAYKGKTVRFIFHYVSGTSYTGDIQIDQVSFPTYFMFGNTAMWAGTTNTFGTSSFTSISSGSGGGNWQTTTSDTSSYIGASFGTVTTTTSALRWNGRSGGTPSSGTGLSSGYGGSGFYVYAETSSSGYSNKNFWLRSGTHAIGNQTGTPYFGFRLGRYGATIGTLKVYVEEI